jgi:D-arabinose 1-dehydrogenase-like Zn-dependent alcohol dehydrogenase
MVSCGGCGLCRTGRTRLCKRREVLGADRHGCWADLVVVPVRNLLSVPDGLSDDVAAVATDAVATAFHAVRTRGAVGPGARVAIWGAGGLGLCAVAIARSLGADTVMAVDPRASARDRALAHGADAALEPAGADDELKGRVDVALEFVGRPETVEAAVRALDRGGRAVAVGIGHGSAAVGRLLGFVLHERELVGSWGSEPDEIRHVLGLMATRELRLPRIVGEVIGLDEVPAALERLARGDNVGPRVVVDVAA